MSVKERIKKYVGFKNISIREFERLSGLNYGYVNSIRVSIQPDKIKGIASYFTDLNIDWLLTGQGDMIAKGETQELKVLSKEMTTTKLVPLLPISAQGGSLDEFVTSVKEEDCEKIISPIKDAAFAITISGDSMAPEYPSGSQVLIKRIDEDAFIEWGRVYVLDTCNGVVVKRIIPSEREDCIKCVSDNNALIYAPFDVRKTDIYGIYRVMLSMSIK